MPKYGDFLVSIQSKYGKTWTRETPYLDTFHVVDIDREAAKILTLSSGKIDQCEYVTGEEILPSDQRRAIEQGKFTYFPLSEAFEI